MSKRSFEMYQYRQVLLRMRQGDSDREIARTGLMGRAKSAAVRVVALERGFEARFTLGHCLPATRACIVSHDPS